MKILHLSTYDISGGAARAAWRLHHGLREAGIASKMLVQDKFSDEDDIVGPHKNFSKFFGRYLRPRLDTLPVNYYTSRITHTFHPQWLPSSTIKTIQAINPDIVHLHWINDGMISIEELTQINKPIIWTLHDMWPFSGGCHYAGSCLQYKTSCGRCPQLHSSHNCDLSHFTWLRKKQSWDRVNISIVTPSHWLADRSRNSSLFHDRRTEVIPNGLDLDHFQAIPQDIARKILRLPNDKKIILFGAVRSTSDKRKGFHLLIPALKQLRQTAHHNIELLILGATKTTNSPDLGFECRYLGTLHDEIALSVLYSAADIFVCPSIEDNLPNTIMESLACATPCVAFNIGGIPDLIDHERNGYLAEPFSSEDLCKGIDWCLDDHSRLNKLSSNARHKAEQSFRLKDISKQYIDLYESILG